MEAFADDHKVSELCQRNLGSLSGVDLFDQIINEFKCDWAVLLRKEPGVDVDRADYFAQKLGQLGLSHGLEFFDGDVFDRLENIFRL